ncbi:DUF6802 family protein [Tomitella cavernea]|uniref:DUF6802 domain-containing protein n=1 Tax=Tomitella cavernea TaxID=1387982 RepID=A0ABP9D033_9ACTN|nr:DUF6802 family protein [Tomitella cavernea]
MWLGNDLPEDGMDGGEEFAAAHSDADGISTWPAAEGGAAGAGDVLAHEPLPFDTITAVDMDGDGVLETMIVHDGEQITVSYDLDGDGHTDYETVFDGEGHAVSWQDRQDPDGTWHWRRVSG